MPQPKIHASAAARQTAYRIRCEKARRTALTAKGLPSLPTIASLPGWKRWNASFAAAQEFIETVLDEMRDYYDERSETWQESDRGDEHQERISTVEEAFDAISGLRF